jgi:DNA-binding NarL/FixJ family response regulator
VHPVESAAPSTVALIAERDADAQIGELLERLGIEFSLFDSFEELESTPADCRSRPMLLRTSAAAAAHEVGKLREQNEHAPIVVICEQIQRWEVRAALAAGASGVVLEDELAHALGPCLLAVCAGQICVPRQHWRQIEPPALSTREKQILGLVVMGYMNSQIAEQLFLAESTVKSHLSSAFGKLGVRSRNEAVSMILDSKRGLGTGILALGGERLETTSTGAQ